MKEVLRSPEVFSHADQYVVGGEVLVPGRVEDAVCCSEDPFITDQTCSTQQLLGAPFIQHHLPANSSVCSYYTGNVCIIWLPWWQFVLIVVTMALRPLRRRRPQQCVSLGTTPTAPPPSRPVCSAFQTGGAVHTLRHNQPVNQSIQRLTRLKTG